MTDMTQPAAMPSVLSERTMTLNLVLSEQAGIVIRSCEVVARGFRNRISFSGEQDISGVLVSVLDRAVRDSLGKVPDEGAHVVSLPEFLVELPGLALSGVHLMIMETRDGLRSAILRFKEFMGSLGNAFLRDIGFQEEYASHAERLATSVLSDICMPMLNLCREMEFALADGLAEPAPEIVARAREFEFQTELLKRFIFNAGRGMSDPTLAHLSSEVPASVRLLPGQR